MKNIAMTSVLLAASSMALAQSSVTLTGNVDAAFQSGSGSVSDRTQLGSGASSSSRFALRGVEDLGGGMSAGFWLESGFSSDNGSGGTTNTNNQNAGANGGGGLTFGRRSTVSLTGSFGELRLGRDYSVQFYNRFELDPFSNNGVGASQTAAGNPGSVLNRVSNSIMYFLPPNLGGVYGELQHHLGENNQNGAATEDDGTGSGVRLGWRNGPLNVNLAHARARYARTATTGDITASNVGGRYDFGSFTLMGAYFRDRVGTVAGLTGRGLQIGGIYRVGVGDIKAQWSSYETNAAGNPESRKISLGYVHNLSKRTALYGHYARVRNSGGASTALNGAVTAINQSSSGFDLGIRHSF
jgi:predicted porin